MPLAAKMAFAKAGARVGTPGSPRPVGLTSWLIKLTLISLGVSLIRMTG